MLVGCYRYVCVVRWEMSCFRPLSKHEFVTAAEINHWFASTGLLKELIDLVAAYALATDRYWNRTNKGHGIDSYTKILPEVTSSNAEAATDDIKIKRDENDTDSDNAPRHQHRIHARFELETSVGITIVWEWQTVFCRADRQSRSGYVDLNRCRCTTPIPAQTTILIRC